MKKSEYINHYCVGCGLCHSAYGKNLVLTDRGFPNSDVKPNEDTNIYERICPVFYYENECKHDVWGTVDKAIIGYSSNSSIRFKAATGGALTELCIYLLEEKIVDGIVHTSYDPDDSSKTISCISSNKEEVIDRCGSRYSISVPLKDILQMVNNKKKYAFLGKPCDVMALRRFIDINKEYEKVFLYLLSFFCAGEPSVNAQEALLNRMGTTIKDCESITYRGNGWPGYTTISNKDGSTAKIEYKVAWGSYLGRDLRNICRFCMDGTGDAADISCADFWYLDKAGFPDFSEHDGRNIIIARTSKGQLLVDGAVENERLICEEEYTNKMSEFFKYQPNHYKRKGTMKTMFLALKLFGKPVPYYSKSYLNTYSKHSNLKQKTIFFFGTIKRIIKDTI